jgi:hypothetical protein
MDYTHDTLGRLSAQDTMMLDSPHGTPVKKVRRFAFFGRVIIVGNRSGDSAPATNVGQR